jgi:hypothetical protein
MDRPKWIYYAVAGFLALVYYIGEATGLLVLTLPIILPLGCWVIINLAPDKPAD